MSTSRHQTTASQLNIEMQNHNLMTNEIAIDNVDNGYKKKEITNILLHDRA